MTRNEFFLLLAKATLARCVLLGCVAPGLDKEIRHRYVAQLSSVLLLLKL
jgi:hypothetical protein